MVQSGIATWYWTGIPALVLHSSIEEGMQTEGGGRFRTSYTVYIPAITYDYQVGSKTYISTTISRPMRYSFRNRLDAEAFIARYPASQQTVAYYNPANPADAVLERMTREHAMSFAPLSLLPFLFAGMLHLAVRGLRS